MLVHTVLFWLKPECEAADRDAFRKGLQSLGGVRSARQVIVGTPALTPRRPIIDASYDFALTVLLDDLTAHDAYQTDPVHRDFVKNFSAMWDRLIIYDAE